MSGIHDMFEVMGSHARRKAARADTVMIGEVKSYDPAHGTVIVTVSRADQPQDIGPMPLLLPWLGPGYGVQGGPEENVQVAVLVIDYQANEFIAIGFLPNDDDHPPAAASKTYKLIDKLGSYVLLDPTQRSGLLSLFAAAVAVIAGAQHTFVGGDNLDTTNDAIITKTKLDAALTAQAAQTKTDITTWAAAHLQPGSGASGPTTMTAVTSSGSSKAMAAP